MMVCVPSRSYILSFLTFLSFKMSNIPSSNFADDRRDLGLTMSEFTQTFEDHAAFTDIATTIVRHLMTGIDLPITSPNSAGNTYGRDDSANAIIEKLSGDVRASLPNIQNNLFAAFFHPGGVYYDMLNSVLDEYWNYIDLITDVDAPIEGWGGQE